MAHGHCEGAGSQPDLRPAVYGERRWTSSEIVKELAAATHEKKLVIPVRLQNIEPKGAFLYELWRRATGSTPLRIPRPSFAELAYGLAQLVRTGARDEGALPFDRSNSRGQASAPSRKSVRKPAAIMAAAVIGGGGCGRAALWIYPRPATVVASSQQPLGPAGISVAVLPFLNLSSDKDQEFFSDGMTEEITSALAKVPGLAVIGRTSAYQFKGQNKDMRAVGKALGASKNLIEGSVRKAGDQVRITAQLIKAADGTHLWTESYDRKLTDIFAVQEDIATAISGALQGASWPEAGPKSGFQSHGRHRVLRGLSPCQRARARPGLCEFDPRHNIAGTSNHARSKLCTHLGTAGERLRLAPGLLVQRRRHTGDEEAPVPR